MIATPALSFVLLKSPLCFSARLQGPRHPPSLGTALGSGFASTVSAFGHQGTHRTGAGFPAPSYDVRGVELGISTANKQGVFHGSALGSRFFEAAVLLRAWG